MKSDKNKSNVKKPTLKEVQNAIRALESASINLKSSELKKLIMGAV